MRYANWRQGTRAIKRVPLPLSRSAADEQERPAPDVGLRPLTGTEQMAVLERARAEAIAKGVPDPQPGEPIYNFAVSLNRVLVGCVDPDDPTQPFFGSEQEILGGEDLGPDAILYLADQQEFWQEEVSPAIGKLEEKDDLSKFLVEIVGQGGQSFFERLRPSIRWSLVRSMAALLLISPIYRS